MAGERRDQLHESVKGIGISVGKIEREWRRSVAALVDKMYADVLDFRSVVRDLDCVGLGIRD
jgi:hypothetical protein